MGDQRENTRHPFLFSVAFARWKFILAEFTSIEDVCELRCARQFLCWRYYESFRRESLRGQSRQKFEYQFYFGDKRPRHAGRLARNELKGKSVAGD